MIAALLRLIDLQDHDSKILIDGVDISKVSAEAVRRGFSVVPQAPFFLPGSVRLNLTASWSSTRSDEAMMAALAKVGLWELIAERGGLDTDMKVVALSHGQQQLFCLATAILRKRKGSIVIMDEAMSGVDDETERTMYELIDSEFRDCTVIAVAHRLKMAAKGCDLVIVLSRGTCVEMGSPSALIQAKGELWGLSEG